jgi:hypothetical protein
MTTRPMFMPLLPCESNGPGVKEMPVEFTWVPGLALSQKQKNVQALHDAIAKTDFQSKVLEISTKSKNQLGISLSAFNLLLPGGYSVETAYQAGKIFEGGFGPFPEVLSREGREVRKYVQQMGEGKAIIGFSFKGEVWPTTPTRLFYNWLYCKALQANPQSVAALQAYGAYTDIEFNPKKSVNCQAYAAALFQSLKAFGVLDEALATREAFISYHPKSQLASRGGKTQREAFQQDTLF